MTFRLSRLVFVERLASVGLFFFVSHLRYIQLDYPWLGFWSCTGLPWKVDCDVALLDGSGYADVLQSMNRHLL